MIPIWKESLWNDGVYYAQDTNGFTLKLMTGCHLFFVNDFRRRRIYEEMKISPGWRPVLNCFVISEPYSKFVQLSLFNSL